MRRLLFTLSISIVCWPAISPGQSLLEVDLLDFPPGAGGLLAARSPQLTEGRVEFMLGCDWGQHFLGIAAEDGRGTRWIVEQRLSYRFAAAYTPSPAFGFSAGFSGAALQGGTRTNDSGAPVLLGPGMGLSHLSAVWALSLGGSPVPLGAALQTTLVLPTADPEALCGGRGMDFRLLALLSYRIWLLEAVLNLGVATRARTRFYDLARGDGIPYRIGIRADLPGWPLGLTAELAGETPLGSPFSSAVNDYTEALIGLRITFLAGMSLDLGAGFGLVGAGAPAARAVILARWSGSTEKMAGVGE